MPITQAPEIGTRLRNRLGIVGEAGFDTISPEIAPVIVVEDLSTAVESEDLECMGAHSFTSGVGDNAQIGLLNPTLPGTVGMIVVCEKIYVTSNATQAFTITLLDGSISGFTRRSGEYRDQRIVGDSGATAVYNRDSAVIAGDLHLRGRQLVNTFIPIEVEWVLPPETHLIVNSLSTNAQLEVTFVWRQRPFGRTD